MLYRTQYSRALLAPQIGYPLYELLVKKGNTAQADLLKVNNFAQTNFLTENFAQRKGL